MKARLRAELRATKVAGVVTPESVAKFAYLHMTDEAERPLVPAVHHWLWLNLLCDQDIRNLLIIAPPESAKTTWLLAWMATNIAVLPEYPMILASASGATAVTRSESLRTLMQSTAVLETFPELSPVDGMSYRAESWGIADHGIARAGRIHPTLRAAGVTGPINGGRARFIIGDDILDAENTLTAMKRGKVYDWLHSTFLSRRMSRIGRAILIGTAWKPDDAYSRIKQAGGWVVCHTPLLADGDEMSATITYPTGYNGQMLGRPLMEAATL